MGAAHAQDAGEPPGEAYVDRIIAPQQLQELPPEEDELADTDGLPSSFHAEAIASRSEYGDDSFDEQGISVGGFRHTPYLGTFSADATLIHSYRTTSAERPVWEQWVTTYRSWVAHVIEKHKTDNKQKTKYI